MFYFCHVLLIFELFLEIKLKSTTNYFISSKFDQNIVRKNRNILKKFLVNKSKCDTLYELDYSILNTPISQILKIFNIELFQEYLNVTQICFFSKKQNNSSIYKKKIFVDFSDKISNFYIDDWEIENILSAKIKRNDEILKHCCKAIRKGILKLKNIKLKRSKSKDNAKILNPIFKNNQKLVTAFSANSITKKLIYTLKTDKEFMKLSHEYKSLHFLKDQIFKYVINKQEEFLSNCLSFENFIKLLFDQKKKHSWILQNIINSIEIYDSCSPDK